MVVMAYVAGLMTPLAAVLGVVGGRWWWRALRRAQAVSEGPLRLTPLPLSPPPPSPQAPPAMNRISLGVVPGHRRAVRRRPPRSG